MPTIAISTDHICDTDVSKLLSLIDEGISDTAANCFEQAMQIAVDYPFDIESDFDDDEAAPALLNLLSTAAWSSEGARAKGMRRFAVASIGADQLSCELWMDPLFTHVIKNDIASAASLLCAKAPSEALRVALASDTARCKAEGNKAAVAALRETADCCLDALLKDGAGRSLTEAFAHLEHCADLIGRALEMGETMYAVNNLFFAAADAFIATLGARELTEDPAACDAALTNLANAAADAFIAAGSDGARFMHLTEQ